MHEQLGDREVHKMIENQDLADNGMVKGPVPYVMQIDTPSDIAARTRFGKFRGLRSWRTSPWDPKENLPREYARVFAFQNPTRALKRCLQHYTSP